MAEKSKRRTRWYSFLNQHIFRSKRTNEILIEKNDSLWWSVWKGHLVHVAILTPHWSRVQAKPLCWMYDLHPGVRVFLQIKALGLHWDLNPAIFSPTHTQLCLSYLCLFDKKNKWSKSNQPCMVVEGLIRSKVQLLDLIGAMKRRKNDGPTETFS